MNIYFSFCFITNNANSTIVRSCCSDFRNSIISFVGFVLVLRLLQLPVIWFPLHSNREQIYKSLFLQSILSLSSLSISSCVINIFLYGDDDKNYNCCCYYCLCSVVVNKFASDKIKRKNSNDYIDHLYLFLQKLYILNCFKEHRCCISLKINWNLRWWKRNVLKMKGHKRIIKKRSHSAHGANLSKRRHNLLKGCDSVCKLDFWCLHLLSIEKVLQIIPHDFFFFSPLENNAFYFIPLVMKL